MLTKPDKLQVLKTAVIPLADCERHLRNPHIDNHYICVGLGLINKAACYVRFNKITRHLANFLGISDQNVR